MGMSLTAMVWKSAGAPILASLEYLGLSERHIMPGNFQLWAFLCLLP